MRYQPREETIILTGDENRGPDLGDFIDLREYVDLGRTAQATPAQRQRARSACASSKNKYQYLSIDMCASVVGKGPTVKVSTTGDVAKFVRQFINPQIDVREHFGVMLLDPGMNVLGFSILTTGTLTTAQVDIAAALKPALFLPSHAMIVVHNHPADDVRPSQPDLQTTALLLQASRLLGLRLIDHIIVSRTKHYSFAENGKIFFRPGRRRRR